MKVISVKAYHIHVYRRLQHRNGRIGKLNMERYFKSLGKWKMDDRESDNEKGKDEKRQLSKQNYETKRERKFQQQWKLEFPWLEVDETGQYMTCKVCKMYPSISDRDGAFVKGCNNLRKDTLIAHDQNRKHKMCMDRSISDKRGAPIQIAYHQTHQLNPTTQKRLNALFNTAFYVAKHGRPYSAFTELCSLQAKNGVDLGSMYRNDKGCKTFIEHIASSEIDKIKKEVENSRYFSVLSDGSTDSSITEQEAVYIRYIGPEGRPKTEFCDIVPLESADASGVLQGIDKALKTVGIDDHIFKSKLVGCNFDGAAVMMGKKGGVAAKVKEKVPHAVAIHCVAHNLELAVLDSVKTVPYLSNFDKTVKNIFLFYYYSPKKRRELRAISDLLDEDAAYFSGMKQVRWLASRHRALKAIEKHYAVTILHLENTASGNAVDAAKAKGILKEIKSQKFVKFLHFMLDVTNILAILSQSYQQDELFITDVIRNLEKAMWQLKGLQHDKGEMVKKFEHNFNTELRTFSCGKENAQIVKLDACPSDIDTDKQHSSFLEAVVEYMDRRFTVLQLPPFSDMEVFDHTMWPSKDELFQFGNDAVANLIKHFESCFDDHERALIPSQWSDLKLRLHRQRSISPLNVYSNLLLLNPPDLQAVLLIVRIILTLSPTTAKCERCFSCMNRVKTNLKTTMTQRSLTTLMRCSMLNASVDTFEPDAAIAKWLSSSQRKRGALKGNEKGKCPSTSSCPAAEAGSSERQQTEPSLPTLDMSEPESDSD